MITGDQKLPGSSQFDRKSPGSGCGGRKLASLVHCVCTKL